jgi:carotenoid cleavage dioxygenase
LDNNYPSETLFVATPGGTREDDGILISHVFDDVLDETNLYIINATTMETISKSKLPTNIPVAIHGRFFPDP